MKINEENYVDKAEEVICRLRDEKSMVTTSKLRNLLAMSMDIYNEAVNQSTDKLSKEICSRIEYLRVRFLYEAGREDTVKKLVDQAGITGILKEIKGSKEKYILFNRYMEALVAFHKYYGGRDD